MTKETKPAVRRVYVLTDAKGDTRLVNATSPSHAITHAYKPLVRVASQRDLIQLRAMDVEEAA